jgi:hypothetical protein
MIPSISPGVRAVGTDRSPTCSGLASSPALPPDDVGRRDKRIGIPMIYDQLGAAAFEFRQVRARRIEHRCKIFVDEGDVAIKVECGTNAVRKVAGPSH